MSGPESLRARCGGREPRPKLTILRLATPRWSHSVTVYSVLMVCRFALGFGVGGKYSLAATIRAEACSEPDTPNHTATEVGARVPSPTPANAPRSPLADSLANSVPALLPCTLRHASPPPHTYPLSLHRRRPSLPRRPDEMAGKIGLQ